MMQRKIQWAGNCFVAGSVGEGLNPLLCLFTKEECDIDVMGSLLETVAMERQHDGNVNVLKLESSKLHPGYALLRILGSDTSTNDNRYLSSQRIRNIDKRCIRDADYGGLLSSFGGIPCLLHGPAFKFDTPDSNYQEPAVGHLTSLDLVLGIHCDEWPSVADEWIERKRSGWPSGTMIAEAVNMGCDLVPIGPAGNSMEDEEWRISLVRAERHLVHTLNSAQLKTLVLLKIIFKYGVFGEIFHKRISSYVAKTAFFWTSEENNGDQWEDRHCIHYLCLCLRQLLYFVANLFCPNYFMRDCNVLRQKLNDLEKQSFFHTLDNFIKKDNFKEKILSLLKTSGSRNTFVGCLSNMKFSKNDQVLRFLKSGVDRELQEKLGKDLLMFLSLPTAKNFRSAIDELLFLLRSFQNSSLTSNNDMDNIAFQDFFIGCLTCAQLRLVNAAIFRNELTEYERFDILHRLLSNANLKTETLCAADITQIAHVFFTNALYKNALHLIIPMLEEFKKVQDIGPKGIRLSLKQFYYTFFNWNDLPFASLRRPVCDISFFSLEESILTEHLRLEIVLAELGYGMALWSGQSKSFACHYHVNVHSFVYAYYMKYKCCLYMERNVDSFRALQELEDQVLENTEHEYFNLNLLGCSVLESGNFEKAMKIFALAYRKRDYRISVYYHVGILLRRCLKDNYKTDIGTN